MLKTFLSKPKIYFVQIFEEFQYKHIIVPLISEEIYFINEILCIISVVIQDFLQIFPFLWRNSKNYSTKLTPSLIYLLSLKLWAMLFCVIHLNLSAKFTISPRCFIIIKLTISSWWSGEVSSLSKNLSKT